jgi:ketopantoate reductase
VTGEPRSFSPALSGAHHLGRMQDREAGKQLEVDCMTGAVIEIADRLGLAVTWTRAVHARIETIGDLQRG